MSYLCLADSHAPLGFDQADVYLFHQDFARRQLHIMQQPRAALTDERVSKIVSAEWNRYADSQLAAGKYGHLTISQLFRFERFAITANSVTLYVSQTDYREVYGTNITHPEILHTFGNDQMGNALGLCSILKSLDGFYGVFRRSEHVLELPGYYHLCAGLFERRKKDALGEPDVHGAMAREIIEELSLGQHYISGMSPIGLCRGLLSNKHELLFLTQLAVERDALERSTLNFEHKQVLWLSEADIATFVADHWHRLAPAAKAALGLHLLDHLGDDSFRRLLPNIKFQRRA